MKWAEAQYNKVLSVQRLIIKNVSINKKHLRFIYRLCIMIVSGNGNTSSDSGESAYFPTQVGIIQ